LNKKRNEKLKETFAIKFTIVNSQTNNDLLSNFLYFIIIILLKELSIVIFFLVKNSQQTGIGNEQAKG